MELEHDILTVLREAGPKGLSVKHLSLNVYNMQNSLFQPLDRDRMHLRVSKWLRDTVRQSGAPVEKTEVRGHYRLNLNSPKVKQLMISFAEKE